MAISAKAFRFTMFRSFSSGVSFNSWYRSALSHGSVGRRSDLLALWNDVKREVLNSRILRGVASDVIPPHVELTESPIHYSSPFIYKARVDVLVKETGIQSERFVTVLSEKALTMREVSEQIVRKWPVYEYGRSEKVTKIEPTAALHYIS